MAPEKWNISNETYFIATWFIWYCHNNELQHWHFTNTVIVKFTKWNDINNDSETNNNQSVYNETQ